MEFAGRYQDGLVADVRDALCVIDLAAEPVVLVVLDGATREIIDRWRADDVYLLHSRSLELRIANRGKPPGARIGVTGIAAMQSALNVLPQLARSQRGEAWQQVRTIVLATAALACIVFAYVFGVPLIADQLAAITPPDWEIKLGAAAAPQIEAALTEGQGFVACDPDPNSIANQAIARFVGKVFDGLGSPFHPTVTVVRSSVPNAFALPGGQTYYLSALIDAAQTPEEFAGVLAHELGHVYYRHGMRLLIASSATGMLVGFVLGDMTGLSVPAALGTALIDNRFSRQDEVQADAFAAQTAKRLGFSIHGLVDLLQRVAADDAYSQAFALFSNHPLTDERRRSLAALDQPVDNPQPVFSDTEWAAIRAMCPPVSAASASAAATGAAPFAAPAPSPAAPSSDPSSP